MNIKNKTRVEKELQITEPDIVNGGEVLILIGYAIKENEDLWSFPAPQIYNEELYLKNKVNYDNVVLQFRRECEVYLYEK